MKKAFTFSLCLLLVTGLFAQENMTSTGLSGGLLGVVNSAYLNVGGTNPQGIGYKVKQTGGGGIWINFPLCRWSSVEAQGIYTSYNYLNDFPFGTSFRGSMDFAHIPLFLKFNVANPIALTAGMQFDFLLGVNDNNNFSNRGSYRKSTKSLLGGIELFPHGRFTFFGRYIHGLHNLDKRGLPASITYYQRNYQAGVKIKLFSGTAKAAPIVIPTIEPVAVAPVDSDKDGINDADDKCPNQAGLSKYGGCPIPDTDGDGINDEEDKCANQKGLAKYNGCPIPDSDKDGINDEEDKCITQPGVARYQGCPVPDKDSDGVNDEEDRCPDEAGISENKGCPKINYQANKVTFNSGKAVLTAAGKKELNALVAFLANHPDLKISLDGYTDNSGSDKINFPLSEKRAAAAKQYLVSKGIAADKITTAGHGSADPVADNSTAQGKAMNRRVEVTVQ